MGKYSSEKERRTPREWTKGSKRVLIQVDREQTLEVDRTILPAAAQFKGPEDVVVQDVVVRTDNVLFHKETFYSPGAGQSYRAPLPPGYDGQFGPGIQALTIVFAFGANVSEPKILELYRNVGVVISAGQVSTGPTHQKMGGGTRAGKLGGRNPSEEQNGVRALCCQRVFGRALCRVGGSAG